MGRAAEVLMAAFFAVMAGICFSLETHVCMGETPRADHPNSVVRQSYFWGLEVSGLSSRRVQARLTSSAPAGRPRVGGAAALVARGSVLPRLLLRPILRALLPGFSAALELGALAGRARWHRQALRGRGKGHCAVRKSYARARARASG
jgi:hypothetical protein